MILWVLHTVVACDVILLVQTTVGISNGYNSSSSGLIIGSLQRKAGIRLEQKWTKAGTVNTRGKAETTSDGLVEYKQLKGEFKQDQKTDISSSYEAAKKKCRISFMKGKYIADCSRRNLTDIPSDLPHNITVLDLSQNRLSNLTRNAFSKLKILVSLNLSDNDISRVSRNAFVGLRNLKTLDLGGNQLDLQNKSAFCNLHPFRPLRRLVNLDVSRNRHDFTQAIPDQCLLDLRQITYLHITVSNMFVFSPGFQNLTKLGSIDLSSSSQLTTIGASFFRNLQRLPVRSLSLAMCNISNIHSKAFENIRDLRKLDLSNNTYLGMKKAFQSLARSPCPKLSVFIINAVTDPDTVNKVIITSDMFTALTNTSLSRLYMDSNMISNIKEGAIEKLPLSLTAWSLRNNKLLRPPHAIKSLHRLINLKYLNAFNQGRTKPANSKATALSNSANQQLLIFNLPPKLEYLKYTNADRFHFGAERIYLPNNSLKFVDLSWNNLIKLPAQMFGLEKVEKLTLEHNYIQTSNVFFDSFPGLTSLYLRGNNFKVNFEYDYNGHTLGKLENLQALRLGKNGIAKLFPQVFRRNSKLVYLNLGTNKLTKLGCRINHMTQLKKLDLSRNSLNYLEESAIVDLETIAKYTKISVNIQQNSLLCSCESLAFLKWTLSPSSNITLVAINRLKCISADGKKRLFLSHREEIVKELEIQCASHFPLIIGLSLSLLTCLLVVTGGLVYRFRWKLRYIYHIHLLRKFLGVRGGPGRNGYTPINGDEPDCACDVFVSYADDDREFVIKEMLPVLENRHGLKMYIRHRDSIAGLEIATNITRAVSCSRVTVLLLSKRFLENHWCNYEFQMARVEGVMRRQTVQLFLLYGDITPAQMPDDLVTELQSGTFVELPPNTENGDEMDAFWTIFVREIGKYGHE